MNDEGLNYALLFSIYQGNYRSDRWNPKTLMIDIMNLRMEGLIEFGSSVGVVKTIEGRMPSNFDDVHITPEGKEVMENIMNKMIDESRRNEDDRQQCGQRSVFRF